MEAALWPKYSGGVCQVGPALGGVPFVGGTIDIYLLPSPFVFGRGSSPFVALDPATVGRSVQMRFRILLVASGGGHWQQLMQMRTAFDSHEMFFLTTLPGLPEQFSAKPAAIVPECNRNAKFDILRTSVAIGVHVVRFRPMWSFLLVLCPASSH